MSRLRRTDLATEWGYFGDFAESDKRPSHFVDKLL
jgi:hypothetical protein